MARWRNCLLKIRVCWRYRLLREGANHGIYTNGIKFIPIKRHRQLDRITANELCKHAGLEPVF
ncbi:hypothetical protein C6366_13430 [Desulfonatronum sp. SC1]|nr:hypothetical protein C6366_13430 [Desulfonatronum sp. SC1]